jgi:hypothetical protein
MFKSNANLLILITYFLLNINLLDGQTDSRTYETFKSNLENRLNNMKDITIKERTEYSFMVDHKDADEFVLISYTPEEFRGIQYYYIHYGTGKIDLKCSVIKELNEFNSTKKFGGLVIDEEDKTVEICVYLPVSVDDITLSSMIEYVGDVVYSMKTKFVDK